MRTHCIVASHRPEEKNFSFRFTFDEGPKLQAWTVLEPVERFDVGSIESRSVIGVSSPYGIVPLSRSFVGSGHYLLNPKYFPFPGESEYITTSDFLDLPIDFLFSFHCLKEARLYCLRLIMESDTQFSLNASLFHTLKALHVGSISSTFFAGQTFHKLERYKEGSILDEHTPRQGPLTEMPVCTRLVVPLHRLATLKLPQIRELGVLIDGKYDHIWEKHIAVNANLSGLKLLHLRYAYRTRPTISVIKILGSLPALKTLITDNEVLVGPYVNFFEAFVLTYVLRRSGLNQSSWEGQISGLLCPRLESLQIEGINVPTQADLMPVLKDIVALRAIIGSPLRIFTFYYKEDFRIPKMWQLIGRDKSFMMEEVVPAKEFLLDI